jgi:hypothetical protein
MGKVKGADIVFLRKRLKTLGQDKEREFLSQLSEDETKYYQQAMNVSWIPVEITIGLQTKAAPILFPEHEKPVLENARQQCREDLRGIYRVLLRIININTLLKQLSKVWSTYNDTGSLVIASREKSRTTLVLENYPDYPKASLENIEGYIIGCLEMAGIKDFTINTDDSNPEAWKFQVNHRDLHT